MRKAFAAFLAFIVWFAPRSFIYFVGKGIAQEPFLPTWCSSSEVQTWSLTGWVSLVDPVNFYVVRQIKKLVIRELHILQ